jgi:hypothetical protein
MVQFVKGMVVKKIKFAGASDPYGSGSNIKMADLAGLDI